MLYRRLHAQINAGTILWKGNHISNRGRTQQYRHKSIQAQSHAAMRRASRAQGTEQMAKVLNLRRWHLQRGVQFEAIVSYS